MFRYRRLDCTTKRAALPHILTTAIFRGRLHHQGTNGTIRDRRQTHLMVVSTVTCRAVRTGRVDVSAVVFNGEFWTQWLRVLASAEKMGGAIQVSMRPIYLGPPVAKLKQEPLLCAAYWVGRTLQVFVHMGACRHRYPERIVGMHHRSRRACFDVVSRAPTEPHFWLLYLFGSSLRSHQTRIGMSDAVLLLRATGSVNFRAPGAVF